MLFPGACLVLVDVSQARPGSASPWGPTSQGVPGNRRASGSFPGGAWKLFPVPSVAPGIKRPSGQEHA